MTILNDILKEKTPAVEAFHARHAEIEKRRGLLAQIGSRREKLREVLNSTLQKFYQTSEPKDFEKHLEAVKAFNDYDGVFVSIQGTANSLNNTIGNEEAKGVLLPALKCVGDRLQAKIIQIIADEKAALALHGIRSEDYSESAPVTVLRAQLSKLREAQSKVAECGPEHCINIWGTTHQLLIAQ